MRTKRVGECLIWTGGKTNNGYGKIYKRGAATNVYVHRMAWELANGPIPAGAEIDHTCWNRLCVEPAHLRLVAHKQNTENMSGPRPTNRSGYRGVSRSRQGRWYVRVQHNGKCHYGGIYDSPEEADAAARALRNRLFTHSQN